MYRVPGSKTCQFRCDLTAASAVEFALIAPVFLLLVFGTIAYAIYFGAAHSVQQIAADATRTSISGLTDTERDQLVSSFIAANAGSYPMIAAEKVSYRIDTDLADTDQYRLIVAYDASSLPIWNLNVPLPLPSTLIRYTSTIRKGGI